MLIYGQNWDFCHFIRKATISNKKQEKGKLFKRKTLIKGQRLQQNRIWRKLEHFQGYSGNKLTLFGNLHQMESTAAPSASFFCVQLTKAK